ncbi:helix-hairpin-helix domain-containing protein [Duganella sp. BJB1802]|uniref:ComEA family DNA-binding protein n=1 Tax=Duganella sp. BJB1802 TaxID=2744575 RepID=UPI0015947EAE|nr:helix-hairpin-helix domain-containing protein [Duganella sp. BJB1802]NVD73114.1 helix-hairpin-helix domain-containing protein [Duganella sp. BJB1802]
MFKKLLLAVATLIATMGFAFAQVDVNKADAAALDSVKGIGPAKTKAIMEERKKGDFKDWADLEKRVKGIGEKNAVKLSQAGLVVNGKPLDGAPAATAPAAKADKATDKAAAKADKAAAKAAKADKADKADKPAAPAK